MIIKDDILKGAVGVMLLSVLAVLIYFLAGGSVIGDIQLSPEKEEAYWQPGDRCYVPDMRQHGTVELHYSEWGVYLWSVELDNGHSFGGHFLPPPNGYFYTSDSPSLELSRQLIGTGGVLKVNNSKYLKIADSPAYPSPLLRWYANSVSTWHAHPPIDDIKGYCIAKYGNYAGGISCYTETDDEVVYYEVTGLDLTVWKLQNLLDNKSNLNKPTLKVRKSTQSYQNHTEIDYTLLKSWMDYYNLTYNNQSLVFADFGEIKNNTPFMSEYCSIYGYSGYDGKCSICYRAAREE